MNENNESGNDPRECGFMGCGHPSCESFCEDVSIERVEANRAVQEAEDFNWWALQRSMNGVLSVDDYDELRDFR